MTEFSVAQLQAGLADYAPYQWPGDYPDAAVAVGLYEDGRVLLVKKAAHMRKHAGEVGFPGGRVEPGDSSLEATALRELREETGIGANHFRTLAQLDQRLTYTRIRVTPFIGAIEGDPPITVDQTELDDVFTVPLPSLMDGSALEMVPFDYRGREVDVPHFYTDSHTIWGITAIILIDVINSLLGGELPLDPRKQW